MPSRTPLADLDRLGIARLPGLLSDATVREMAGRLWDFLAARDGIQRDDRASWRRSRPSHFRPLVDRGAFAALETPGVVAALDELFGAGGWQPPRRWGEPLVCLPGVSDAAGSTWSVPRESWHLDLPVGPGAGRRGVRLFALLEPVPPHGGGTLVVTGSHRLAQRLADEGGAPLRSARVKETLVRSSPWLRELCTGGDEPDRTRRLIASPGSERGVDLELAELTGRAGDVIVMDLRVLHAPAPNRSAQPRVVLGQAIFARAR